MWFVFGRSNPSPSTPLPQGERGAGGTDYAIFLSDCRPPHADWQAAGSLSTVPAPKLAAAAIRAALADSGLAAGQVDEVILGNVLSAGIGQAPARQAALAAGIPASVGAVTINKVCGSGLKAVMLADQAIRAGDARVIVAGGMESMSLAPHLAVGGRGRLEVRPPATARFDAARRPVVRRSKTPAWAPLADYTAAQCHVSSRAARRLCGGKPSPGRRRASGREVPGRDCAGPGQGRQSRDARRAGRRPAAGCTLADLAKLRPAPPPTEPPLPAMPRKSATAPPPWSWSDEALARESNSPLKARIVATATSGVAPKDLFIAPVSAIEKVLAKAGLKIDRHRPVRAERSLRRPGLACARRWALTRTS